MAHLINHGADTLPDFLHLGMNSGRRLKARSIKIGRSFDVVGFGGSGEITLVDWVRVKCTFASFGCGFLVALHFFELIY